MLRRCFQLFIPFMKLNNRTASEIKIKNSLIHLWNNRSIWPLCCDVLGTTPSRNIHWSLPRCRRDDRRAMLASLPTPDEGTSGEKSIDVDSLVQRQSDVFPDKNTYTSLFNDVPFKDIPICNISVSKNNTIMNLTTAKGDVLLIRSCGMDGFKNARKGTNVAAQTTALNLGAKVIENGIKTVRVRVKGLGPGRMAAIKGLQMSGLDIISVTDNTPVSWNPPRPRKQRRL